MNPIMALVFTLAFFTACTRKPPANPGEAMRLKRSVPELQDDLPLGALADAVELQARYLESLPTVKPMVFGPRIIAKPAYIAALYRFSALARLAEQSNDRDAFFKAVREEFDFYEVYGDKSWGQVFITSYYAPRIQGSRKATPQFKQALYRQPEDLLLLDLVPFDAKYASERKYRARLINGNKIVPYYSRQEIDEGRVLAGKNLEIAWVDPIDAFDLQIQGSGSVDLGIGGVLRLGYGEKNGHRYEAIGKLMLHAISLEELNSFTIERFLREMPEPQMRAYLNKNPSYVFFKEMEGDGPTFLGVPPTDGRTIATDGALFPKGALAFLSTTKPRFEDPQGIKPSGWDPFGRFVMDQDVGGAIKGGGRLDLFWGRGRDARRYAGLMKQQGTLQYLVPKERSY